MALLNRFSKLNDRGETGIFTFIVTKSVTRDFHRDATTKDFCFGYHRWAISFQRPTEKVLGVHLLLRNPSPSTSCVVDFTLMLLNREHFSQNEVYTKRQAKFTITNPMQGVPRWIQMSDLSDRHFSNETGEFLFELSLSNMTTIFECDIQLSPAVLNQYKCLLKNGASSASQQLQAAEHQSNGRGKQATEPAASQQQQQQPRKASGNEQLINLETNYFTFGAFDWSLTIVPLVNPSRADANQPQQQQQQADSASSGASSSSASSSAVAANQQQQQAQASANHLLTPNRNLSSSSQSIASNSSQQVQHNNKAGAAAAKLEPVCRVYLNRLNGLDCLCRVKYRVILGHHQPAGSQHPSAQHVDSRVLDQISDSGGRIRGHQFRATNILKLISLRQSSSQADSTMSAAAAAASSPAAGAASGGQVPAPSQHHHSGSNNHHQSHHHHQHSASSTLDLRVHIEMFCANTISEARVPLQRKPNEAQASNCSDRNKQAWCVESDCESENVRLKLFFMDLQSVPRNHIRYISWVAYVVARDARQGRESLAVRNAPHSNYYLQDGIDMGTIMETDIAVKELTNPSGTRTYLDGNQLTVHIEWVDSLLLFSHLYNNYDSLATIQRHQMRRELSALQMEYELLERKYFQSKRSMSQLLSSGNSPSSSSQQLAPSGAPIAAPTGAQTTLPANAAADWSTSQHSIGCEQADNNAPATQPARHQPHRRKISPMSHAERLKFSSSTPPSRQLSAMQPQQPHPAGQTRQPNNSPSHLGATSEQHQQQQLDQPQGHGHGSARRRLPQQPLAAGPLVKTLEREWMAQRVCGTPPAHSRRDSQVSPSAGATYQQHMRASLGSLELGAGSVSLMPGNGAGAGGPSAHPLLDQRRVSPSDLAELAAPAPRRAHSTMGQLAHAAVDPLAAYHHHLNHNHHQMDLHQANVYSAAADFTDPHRRTSHELYLPAADRPPFGEMDEADYLVRLQQQPDADENEGDELELEMQSLYVAAAGGGDNGSMRQGVALVDGEQILMSSTAAYYEQPDLARASSKQQLVVESSAASIVTQSRSSPQIERRMNIHLDEHQFDSHQYERHYELQ